MADESIGEAYRRIQISAALAPIWGINCQLPNVASALSAASAVSVGPIVRGFFHDDGLRDVRL